MAANIHLQDIEHVALLAKAAAQANRVDQFIYKTKDHWHNEIFAFTSEEAFKAVAIRVVRYTREDKHEAVLQNSGIKQPNVVSEATGVTEKAARKAGK